MTLLIGCTGGIGSGKSTVTALLGERGAIPISADDFARAALQPGSAASDAVLARFGEAVTTADGALDRKRLARVVFNDADALAELEAIVHPIVYAGIDRRLAEIPGEDQVVVFDSPLLVEKRDERRLALDGLLVVDAPEDLALDRLVRLRKMDKADAQARIAAQATRVERLQVADFVIMNMGTLDELVQMVDNAWRWIQLLREAPRAQKG